MDQVLPILGEFLRQAFAVARVFLLALLRWVVENPCESFTMVLGFGMLLGTVIQSGTRGVQFRFGRVRGLLEPGFHPLLPWFDQVQKVHTRAVTLDVPAQRVTTRDGMVYDVDANVVYRLADPVKALVEVDDWKHGVATRVALTVHELVRTRDRGQVREREDLDQELTELLGPRLAAWGIVVERAGFTSIAPTGHTLHVTQLAVLVRERTAALGILRAGGVPDRLAVALLGADRRLVSHAHRRYARAQAARTRAELRAVAAPAPPARPAERTEEGEEGE